jgi:asparagine synthase (glutamine-hydrolysing)
MILMCGIAAILHPLEIAPPEENTLKEMVNRLSHRGPDAEGFLKTEGGGAVAHMGHRRLSVIDLSQTGSQPMTDSSGRYTIVYNGEIYNYRELRSELESEGLQLMGESDTEVLLNWFIFYGWKGLDELRGIYSFLLFDRQEGKAFAAIDPIGVKPLYWTENGGSLSVASELKALITLIARPAVSPVGLAEYFHRLCIPAPNTIIDGVFKLVPAGRLEWTPTSGTQLIEPERFGLADHSTDPDLTWDLLHQAVERRWVSDVPVGVFLSGGLDSGAIVAASRHVQQQNDLRTFTIGYDEPYRSFNELDQARLTADFHATRHFEQIVTPEITDLLPSIAYHLDEPFADSSALPTWLVCRHTSKHVKVAISGIGGDECFGGYPRYQAIRLAHRTDRFPLWLKTLLGRTSRFIPESDRATNYGGRLARFLRALPERMEGKYRQWVTFDDGDLSAILPQALWNEVIESGADPSLRDMELLSSLFKDYEPSEAVAIFDLLTYIPADLLFMADRMSMAHGLELRVPFCDIDLIKHVFGLPVPIKYHRGQLKGHLKRVLRDKLPAPILSGRKQGFMVPLSSWIRNDLKDLLAESAGQVVERGWVNNEWVLKITGEHKEGKRVRSDELWALIMLAQWGEMIWDPLT